MADWGQIAGIAGQVGANMAGERKSAEEKAEELRLLREALAEYEGIGLPDASPELLGPSAYAGIESDPETREAQMAALDELLNVYRSGGMTLEDKANLAAIQTRTAPAERSAREGIREQMQARGVSGGGSELAMQLAAQQGSANRAAAGGLETAAAAQKRALDAILARGRMAGDIRGQDRGEKERTAGAADSVARYNAATRANARQQGYQNQMSLANAKANARRPVASHYGEQAQDTRAQYGGYGMAAAEAGRAWDGGETEEEKAARKRRENGGQ